MGTTILGAGTWGLALANLLAQKGESVISYTPFSEEASRLSETRIHPRFPGVSLSRSILFTSDLKQALEKGEVVVYAVPSPYIRETARKCIGLIREDAVLVSVAKGLEDGSFLTMSQVIEEELPGYEVVCLSGPTHAEEVAKKIPTAIVSSSLNNKNAEKVRDLFSTSYFRVYTNDDIYGSELCGALKNIIALASGICDGLLLGDNTKAALITRGLAEIKRLGLRLGAKEATFYGLCGLGDLVVTATSMHSRNHEAGVYIGEGYSVDEAVRKVGMAVEGLNALDAAYHLSVREKVDMPIVKTMYEIVHEGLSPKAAVKKLFKRSLKAE